MASLNLGNKITIYRGDDYDRELHITDGDAEPIDITGWVVYFTGKNTATYSGDTTDTDAIVQIVISSHTNPTGGITTLTIPSETTNTITPEEYVYDIQRVDSGNVRTLIKGDLSILADVTRTE